MDITINATEFPGAMKVRFITVEITNYSQGGTAFSPNAVGMNRFQSVRPDVVDGSGWNAQYDESTGSLYLRGESNDGGGSGNESLTDAPSGTSATISIMAMGR